MQKSSRICLVLFTILTGCGYKESPRTGLVETQTCPEELAGPRREWILKCISGANPMSDEDPEDWIYACTLKSKEVFCRKDWVLSVKSEETYDWVPCSEALEIPKYSTACENAKLDGNYDE